MINNNLTFLQAFKDLRNNGLKVSNTIELLNYSMNLNPLQWKIDVGFKKTNINYVKKELKWYLSQSLSIEDYVDDVKIWQEISSKFGKINSNYGWCVFSRENSNQFKSVVNELIRNKDSRKGTLIYSRPSIHIDAYLDDMNDFMCTIYTQVFIRNDRLEYIVHQRSCDIIFGFFNDFAWHCFVYRKLFRKLKTIYSELQIGIIKYNIDSFHIYERHYELLKELK